MKCPICSENFVLRYSLQDHVMKDHLKTGNKMDPKVLEIMMGLPGAKPKPEPLPDLIDTPTSALWAELLNRGMELLEAGQDLKNTHRDIMTAMSKFDEHAIHAKTACSALAKDATQAVERAITTAKEQLKAAAESSTKECQTITEATKTECLTRAQTLEEECLRRVTAAEEVCRKAIDTVTTECSQRAESAEAEALRCIEASDRAVAAANALGESFNALNGRLHNLEISIRTLFAGSMGSMGNVPVYQPVATNAPTPAPTPAPPVPAATPAPVAVTEPPFAKHAKNGTSKPKMTFVLIGLHQKNIEHILQNLRKPTQRGVEIIVIEDTSSEAMPKADYVLVAGGSVLDKRWHFCLDKYGPTHCVRLVNGSVVSYRQKIEELYEAKYPFNHPNASINQIGAALNDAVMHAK